jgi:dUTP pyrophosphatase
LELTLKYFGPEALAPRVGKHPGDAGLDLFIQSQTRIPKHEMRPVDLGIAIELPEGYWGWITPRSSTLGRGLHVAAGVVDNGYRGPLTAVVYNLTERSVNLTAGDRIAQLVLMPLLVPAVVRAELLTETLRGVGGFGSTGL